MDVEPVEARAVDMCVVLSKRCRSGVEGLGFVEERADQSEREEQQVAA